ncbi:MAG: hypothetical protein ACI9BD_000909 [Candidatus Marinamargulisbacteria bacterium]|jgi:hypothetical protein
MANPPLSPSLTDTAGDAKTDEAARQRVPISAIDLKSSPEAPKGSGLLSFFKDHPNFATPFASPLATLGAAPFTNALSLTANNPELTSLRSILAKTIRMGPYRGSAWPMASAVPQFICVGPIFKNIESRFGTYPALAAAPALESLFSYGAFAANARTFNQADGPPGGIKGISSRLYGPGFGAMYFRNFLSMAGFRQASRHVESALTRGLEGKGVDIEASPALKEGVQASSNFLGSLFGGACSLVPNDIYNFRIIETTRLSPGEARKSFQDICKDQYGGSNGLQKVAVRAVLRSLRVGVVFTLFGGLERAIVGGLRTDP